ncbi:hypothetical protein [Aurantiacibacter poecillastricola]|uniref:hypothetical protein n=1 Tax=Aurantiacibacter poecillastricola TaxID=3064385 RepID=UPI00273FEEA4|nr:hypothetical protein [Aurantiacibacter sp. 219JJ12-13]MDP5261524.1 hypothetical protein [Aurantiacibacter sp. 219JJ12-13]
MSDQADTFAAQHRRILLARLYTAVRPSIEQDGTSGQGTDSGDYLIESPRIPVRSSTLGDSLRRALEDV